MSSFMFLRTAIMNPKKIALITTGGNPINMPLKFKQGSNPC